MRIKSCSRIKLLLLLLLLYSAVKLLCNYDFYLVTSLEIRVLSGSDKTMFQIGQTR